MGEYIQVPREMLERWLESAESDWEQIDSEWGPAYDGGIEEAVANGGAPEVLEMRVLLGKMEL